jgi:hypothetical protein
MLFAPPPPPPVSFSREVAPIMAMHCNICHGEAGGLSTRSYVEIMTGGNLGKVIVPGDPDKSLFVHFLDGRRGENRRMPKDEAPFSTAQIETIRRWIAEGAKNDDISAQTYRIKRTGVRMELAIPTRVSARVDTEGYVVVTVRDAANGRLLWSEVAVVKSPKGRNATAEPGQLMSWDVRAGNGWPSVVTVELTVQFAAREPRIIELNAPAP